MKKYFILILVLLFISCSKKKENNKLTYNPNKLNTIVSLSPSITEEVFALGLGNRLVGVTNYCKYPKEAIKIPKIGGFNDLNIERIMKMKPDIILCLPSHSNYFNQFKLLHLNYKIVNHQSFQNIKNSIYELGKIFNVEKTSKKIIYKFDKIKKNMRLPIKQKKVLIVVSRSFGALNNIYVAGNKTFYTDALKYAGGINCIKINTISYPVISVEGVLNLNPDVIIEVSSPDSGMALKNKIKDLKKDWQILKNVNAVKNNEIYYIIKNYAVIPGPRIINLINDFKKILIK